jgi:hypothetical protein
MGRDWEARRMSVACSAPILDRHREWVERDADDLGE